MNQNDESSRERSNQIHVGKDKRRDTESFKTVEAVEKNTGLYDENGNLTPFGHGPKKSEHKFFDDNGDLHPLYGRQSPPEGGGAEVNQAHRVFSEYPNEALRSKKTPKWMKMVKQCLGQKKATSRKGVSIADLHKMIQGKHPNNRYPEPEKQAVMPRSFKSPSELAYNVAQALLDRHVFRSCQGRLYIYETKYGYFRLLSPFECKTIIRDGWSTEITKKLSRSVVSDIHERIVTEPSIQADNDGFDKHQNLMNFRDVVLDIKKWKILKHSPAFGFTSYVRADYNPENKSDGEKFRDFIKTCTQKDGAKEKHLQEIVGYMLSNYHKAKIAPFLVGVPNSGKSALIHLITKLIGSENVSNLPLHKLHGKFALAQLSKKKLNVCSELGGSPLSNLDVFKAITGNDRIDAEFKFQDNFSFHSKVKLMFAGNSMPPLKEIDRTTAFFDRLTFVCFNYTVPPDERDHQLVKKLVHEEADYIVAWAVEGIVRLKENRFCFSECPESVEFKSRYIAEQNSAEDFIKNACEFGKGDIYKSHKRDLLEAYEDHCRENILVRLRNAEFFAEIEKRVGRPDRFRINGQSLWGYKGIKLVQ